MYFSNYVEVVPYRNQFALFNKINGILLLLNSENITKDNDQHWICTATDSNILHYLVDNLFFVSDEYVQSRIRSLNSAEENYDDVTLVISTTERCNCECSYCYQLGWDKCTDLSSKEYRNWILAYIDYILSKAPDGAKLTIKYFGGEPLLKLDLIAEINRGIKEKTTRVGKHITVQYEMDSNCTLLTREVFSLFDNLSIATTLTLQGDHDELRSKSFSRVIENLLSVADLFELPQYSLNIGYNAHHKNIASFSAFLEYIHRLNINCHVYVTNIVNYEGSNFRNLLTDAEFEEEYCKVIVPNLLRLGYQTEILPNCSLTRKCTGTNRVSRKFFSNGTQELCSFFPKRGKRGVGDYPDPVLPTSYLEPLPDKCVTCYDYPYCGGIRPCFSCEGCYPLRDVMKNRIKLYLDLANSQEEICTDI